MSYHSTIVQPSSTKSNQNERTITTSPTPTLPPYQPPPPIAPFKSQSKQSQSNQSIELQESSLSDYPTKPHTTEYSTSSYENYELDEELDEEELESTEENRNLLTSTSQPRFSLEENVRETRGVVEHDLSKRGASEDWQTRGSSVWGGIFNMSNSILGAGIVGLPYAIREAGLGMGLILIVTLGLVTDWTLRLIVLTAKMSGRNSYISIMDCCFGRTGRGLASFFQLSFAFGGMTAFCVILGDTVPHFLSWVLPEFITSTKLGNFLTSRNFVIFFMTTSISYPLSLYRSMDKLSFASSISLISMIVIVVSVVLRGPLVESRLKGDSNMRWTLVNTGIFEAIGVISFAFVCHHNSLLIFSSLRIPTIDRFAKITHVSTSISVVACVVMSVAGYLIFTTKTQGNILNNYSPDDFLINIARLCLGINMTFTTPSEAFVCREVITDYFWPGSDFNRTRHIILTTALVFSSMTISLLTCDLGLVLELAGGFSATALAYIFPSVCYIALSGNKPRFDSTRILAFACCGFGIIVMILSTCLSILKAISDDRVAKVC